MRTYGRWSIFSLEGYRPGQLLNGIVSAGPWQVALSSIIFKKGVINWVKNDKKNNKVYSTYGVLTASTEVGISIWPNANENNWSMYGLLFREEWAELPREETLLI